ncbi:MAG: riboflavin biosynthesis protein RibF [candidate division Zixibacteria bacterium]|nr:riboflavin biosynthesis protein RibF [candidate division Zixibacteria bacterium]
MGAGAVCRNIDDLPHGVGRAISLGSFDGFHLGHQAIVKALVSNASKAGLRPLVITFDPHPRTVINPSKAPRLVMTPNEEIDALRTGYDGDILTLPFDQATRNMSASEFIKGTLIERLGMKALICGENHTIGKNREGDAKRLKELASQLGFEFEVVAPVVVDGKNISSTAIRGLIAEGDIPAANKLMGASYRITGEVVTGIKLGHKIGYPTANIKIDPRKALPREGIYASFVDIGKSRYGAMLFVGVNHLDPQRSFSVEANIFDFDRELYGEIISYIPVSYLRESRPIATSQELKAQLSNDKNEILHILEEKERQSVF